jgi:hypothetical protein
MAKKHWQCRRAYARRLVALRAAYRAARHADTIEAWRVAQTAWRHAAQWQSELLHRASVPSAPAWRLARIDSLIWNALNRLGAFPSLS